MCVRVRGKEGEGERGVRESERETEKKPERRRERMRKTAAATQRARQPPQLLPVAVRRSPSHRRGGAELPELSTHTPRNSTVRRGVACPRDGGG